MQLVIIGASFAGVRCALVAKEYYPEATVLLLERQAVIGYVPNALNWLYQQRIQHLEEAVQWQVAELCAAGIDVRLNTEVIAVDSEGQNVQLADGTAVAYDSLVLAMGARQQSAYIIGADHPKVITTKELAQSQRAKALIDQAERITVIGGGLMGLEASATYAQLGKQVVLLEAMDYLDFKNFDAIVARQIAQRATEEGVIVQLGQRAVAIDSCGSQVQVVSDQQQIFVSDVVLLCVNFRPNSELVADQVERNLDHTIVVNDYLQTSHPHIFAVGDLIHIPLIHQVQPCYVPMIKHAQRSGAVAASNLVTLQQPLLPVVHEISSYVFGLYVASVGVTAEEAAYYQDVRVSDVFETAAEEVSWHVHLVVARSGGHLLGAQIVSREMIEEAVALLVSVIAAQTPLHQLVKPETLSSPVMKAVWRALGDAVHE